jgi:hypothetical protein
MATQVKRESTRSSFVVAVATAIMGNKGSRPVSS